VKSGAWLLGAAGALLLHGLLGLLPAPTRPSPPPTQSKLTLRLVASAAPEPKVSPPVEHPAPARAAPARTPPRPKAPAKVVRRPVPKPTAPPRTVAAAEPPRDAPSAPSEAATPAAAPLTESKGPVLAEASPNKVRAPAPPPAEPAPPQDLGPARRAVLAAIQAQERYPRRARRLRQQGVVKVQVVLTARGALLQPPQVQKSSGHRLLDQEALRMVQAAAPFAPLPPGHDGARFVLPIRFALR